MPSSGRGRSAAPWPPRSSVTATRCSSATPTPSTSPPINAEGLRIEGPVEEHTVRVPAVTPDRLEGPLEAVLLAVKAHHTAAAVAPVAPLLAADGFVVSLQNGFNEDAIAAAVGRERVVGAFVNFGADVIAPGRILRGNRAAVHDRRAGRGRHPARAQPRGRHRRCPPDREHPRIPVVEGGLRRDPVCDGGVRPGDRRRARRAPLPAPLPGARARGAGGGDGHAGAVRRLRPRRPRGIHRPAGRVQPALGQDPQRHLSRPGREAPQDGGGRDARRARRPARAAHRRAHPRDRGRPAGVRAGESRAPGRLRAARAARPARSTP